MAIGRRSKAASSSCSIRLSHERSLRSIWPIRARSTSRSVGSRDDERLVVDVAGFEGPLDLLLQLARDQKVDLAKISILALAEQYLAFIEAARRLRLEIAADYLVMAAWLAYLKSRLLLPPAEEDDEPSGEELAAVLARRLRHLEAIREAGRRLMSFARLGIDVFPRGAPEPLSVNTRVRLGRAALRSSLGLCGAQAARPREPRHARRAPCLHACRKRASG